MKLIANLADVDRKTVQQAGISADVLMDNAGKSVADAILQAGCARRHGVIVCGPGNNGGDGFVCSRYLYQAGFSKLTVIYTGTAYKKEALQNFETLMQLPVEVISAEKQLDIAVARLAQADFIVDALFGSGLNRVIENLTVVRLIDAINSHRKEGDDVLVWSVDAPSGVDTQTGQLLGLAVQADYTVTFAAAKPGLYLQPGKAQAGHVQVVDIGIPSALLDEDPSNMRLITHEWVKENLPKRTPTGHKYDYGHALVIAGSATMPGAAVLCAEAAMNAGVGLVTLATPQSVLQQCPIIAEVMRLPLEEPYFTQCSKDAVQKALTQGRFTTVVVGPGLGRSVETQAAILDLLVWLKEQVYTVIVDADALYALAQHPITLTERFVLTPHVGEAARLLGQDKSELLSNLLNSAEALRTTFQCTVVFKSASTVVADNKGLQWISSRGNPGMATAGSGDVLTGIIAALVAQTAARNTLDNGVLIGVYLHGLAGDKAAQALSQYAMRASDITFYLSEAFQEVLNHCTEQTSRKELA